MKLDTDKKFKKIIYERKFPQNYGACLTCTRKLTDGRSILVQETQRQDVNLMQLQSVAFEGGLHQIVNKEIRICFIACAREDINVHCRSMNKPRLSEALLFSREQNTCNGLNDFALIRTFMHCMLPNTFICPQGQIQDTGFCQKCALHVSTTPIFMVAAKGSIGEGRR